MFSVHFMNVGCIFTGESAKPGVSSTSSKRWNRKSSTERKKVGKEAPLSNLLSKLYSILKCSNTTGLFFITCGLFHSINIVKKRPGFAWLLSIPLIVLTF